MSTTIRDTLLAFRNDAVAHDFFLRSVLRHPRWYIPVDESDHPLLWSLGGLDFVAAQSTPASPDGAGNAWIEADGRHLVRNLPSNCAGVVFDLGTPAACVIERDSFTETLEYWADVLDVEDALLNPAPGQALSMLAHEWLLLRDASGEPWVDEEDQCRVVHVFSAPDRLREFLGRRPAYRQSTVAALRGRVLFADLRARSDYDAMLLHHGLDATEVVGPQGAALFIDGMDGRSSARVLPARTIAEIHLFLDFEGASREGRTHHLEYLNDELVARYCATVVLSRRTWWFRPVSPTDDPRDLGAGASRILCAGQLADLVRRRLKVLPDNPSRLDSEERQSAAEAARWAHELTKMLVGGSIPRSAVRTPDGSRYLREIPEMGTEAWISAAGTRARMLAGRA